MGDEKTVVLRPWDGSAYRITGDAGDAGVLGSIEHHGGRYEDDVCRFLRRVVPADGVVVDAGANVGALTAVLSGLAERGRVYAFEPAEQNLAHLRRNVTENSLGNVVVIEAALLDRAGPVSFAFSGPYPAGSHLGTGASGSVALTVPGTTLDLWAGTARLERLDVVKLDIEGAEPAAIRGAEGLIQRFKPYVVCECNVAALRSVGGVDVASFFSQLRRLYGRVGAIGREGHVTVVDSAWHLGLILGDQGVADLVALPPGAGPTGARASVATAMSLIKLRAAHRRSRPPAERNFVVDPQLRLSLDVSDALAIRGPAGGMVPLALTVENHGRWWLSSAFTYEPIGVGWRWYDDAGALVDPHAGREPLPNPIGPGGRQTVVLPVTLPDRAGSYRLDVSLVQESFAWFSDLDPSCIASATAEVG